MKIAPAAMTATTTTRVTISGVFEDPRGGAGAGCPGWNACAAGKPPGCGVGPAGGTLPGATLMGGFGYPCCPYTSGRE